MTPYVSVRVAIGHGGSSMRDDRAYPAPTRRPPRTATFRGPWRSTRRPAKTMPTENIASARAKGSIALRLFAPKPATRGDLKTLHAYAVPSIAFIAKPMPRYAARGGFRMHSPAGAAPQEIRNIQERPAPPRPRRRGRAA